MEITIDSGVLKEMSAYCDSARNHLAKGNLVLADRELFKVALCIGEIRSGAAKKSAERGISYKPESIEEEQP